MKILILFLLILLCVSHDLKLFLYVTLDLCISKMKLLKEINKRQEFLYFVICFYRMIGVSFGGISLNQRGLLMKSKFWHYFGWFGCVFHIIFTIINFGISYQVGIFKHQLDSKLTIITILMFFTKLLLSIMMISISIIYQKHGFIIIKIIIKHSKQNYQLKLIAILWCFHIMMSIMMFIFGSFAKTNIFGFIMAYYFEILLIPIMYSISFISWIISVNCIGNIKLIRKQFKYNDRKLITAKLLIETNHLIKTNFNKMKKVNKYLSVGFIGLVGGIIFSILTLIYLIVIFSTYIIMVRGLPFNLNITILLILNCIINGKVMEETYKLLNDLDNIKIIINNNQIYHGLISLKTTIHKIKCGFNIGGFAKWNKLALLQVKSQSIN